MLNPNDRVVMVSGANRGIGKAIADLLSTKGYRLSLGVRDITQIETNSFPNEVIIHNYEARDPESSQHWVQHTSEHYGAIDALVLNAGVLHAVGFEQGTDEKLDLMWEINFKGPYRLVQAALPMLKQCGHGRVVNLVSLSGKRLMSSGNLGYSASKFAALSLTHAIRHEGWSDGLRATSICPGLVDTDMVADVTPPQNEFKIDPSAIAATAEYALSLPNDASVAEILVNSRLETQF